MELPDPVLPGAVSLLEQLDKKLMVMLRDGKTLIGYLRTIDQFANLVLHETLERIYVDQCYGDIPRGIFLIRGENVVLAGEVDESVEVPLKKVGGYSRVFGREVTAKTISTLLNSTKFQVSIDEILRMQTERAEERQQRYQRKREVLAGRGKLPAKEKRPTDMLGIDDAY
jgi:small nuclear ribonucleoprotein (snRNP)-like protein